MHDVQVKCIKGVSWVQIHQKKMFLLCHTELIRCSNEEILKRYLSSIYTKQNGALREKVLATFKLQVTVKGNFRLKLSNYDVLA